ncbi:phosphopantetheine-binding protein [Streptomyces sp. HNM0574]|uniref:phosphopantetheine-binding protein n=1 Tax=Streptomyces sp. HNM0574 TaxID=2714954 RepID=UPI00146A1627|nr:phosphopantetheine-binding protein [Streptomyces sp. HNM0574]NLU68775.1 hypothetical protein [Streptomyces sp. HNM0574]
MASERNSPTGRVELLCHLFAEVLGAADVGARDRFLDLGGDSISALALVSRARDAGLEFTRRDLFLNQSPAELASVAKQLAPEAEPEAEPAAAPSAGAGTAAGNDALERTPLVSLSPAELDDITRRLR